MQIQQLQRIQDQQSQRKQIALTQIQVQKVQIQHININNNETDIIKQQKAGEYKNQQQISKEHQKIEQYQVNKQYTYENQQNIQKLIQIKIHQVFYPSQNQQLKQSSLISSQIHSSQKDNSLIVDYTSQDKNMTNKNEKIQQSHKNKQINLQNINLDKNKIQDRALYMLYKICKINKQKQQKFRIRNKSNINQTKINQDNNNRTNSIGKIKKVLYQSLDSSRQRLNNLFNTDDENRKQKIGRIVKRNLSQDKNKSISQYSSLVHSPRNLANIGRIVKLAKSNNNQQQFNFNQSYQFQKQVSGINSPYYKKSLQFAQQNVKQFTYNLPPLPKRYSIPLSKKQLEKQEKRRQVLTLQKYKKINFRRELKKFIISIILQICDQAVDRVEQKRSFFSYRFHRYNNLKNSSVNNKNNWYGGIKMGEHIMLKSQRMIQNKQGMYYNTLSLSRNRKSSLVSSKQLQKSFQADKSNDESENQSKQEDKKSSKNQKQQDSDSQKQQNSSNQQQKSGKKSQQQDQNSDSNDSSSQSNNSSSSSSNEDQKKSQKNNSASSSDSSKSESESQEQKMSQQVQNSNKQKAQQQIEKIKIDLKQQQQQNSKKSKNQQVTQIKQVKGKINNNRRKLV